MKRLVAALCALLTVLIFFFAVAPAHAAAEPSFSFRLDTRSATEGNMVKLKVCLSPGAQAAAFRVRVAYDDSVLSFSGIEQCSAIAPGTLETNGKIDPIYSVYACNTETGCAPELSGTVLTYCFRVKPGALSDETDLCACADEVYDYSVKPMQLDAYATLPLNVKPLRSGTAALTALEPTVGTLEPAFSPDIFSYRLTVGSAVQSVEFRADAAEHGRVRVSRKTLQSPGQATPISITVISQDGAAREVYNVMVTRAAAETPETRSAVDGQPKPASSRGGSHSSAAKKGSALSQKTGTSRRIIGEKEKSTAERALKAAASGRKTAWPSAAGSSNTASPHGVAQTVFSTSVAPTQAAPLTVFRDGMPSWVAGMLAAGFCIVIGILLRVWFSVRKK